jgi:flagellar biosynthesis/type III secretory pathway chaperone
MSPVQHQLFVQLRDHLDLEVALHRRLLGLAEAKQRLIVAGDMQEFSTLLAQEQAPLADMNRLRVARERLLRLAVQQLGLKPDSMRMSLVVDSSPEGLRPDLRSRQLDLKNLLERLREVNERNMVLIRQSLSFVRDLMHVIVGEPPSQPAAYDRRGIEGGGMRGNGRLVNLLG